MRKKDFTEHKIHFPVVSKSNTSDALSFKVGNFDVKAKKVIAS